MSIELVYNDAFIIISDLIGREFNNPFDKSLLDNILKKEIINSKSKVLDIGSGKGPICMYLARKVNAAYEGVELSTNMYKYALKELAKDENKGLPIKYYNDDFLNLQLMNNTYDLLLGLDVFCYFENWDHLLARIFKILRSTGTLCFTTYFSTISTIDLNNNYSTNLNNINNQIKRVVDTWQIKVPQTVEWYVRKLQMYGFINVNITDSTDVYYSHWQEMQRRTLNKKDEISYQLGEEIYSKYISSIEVILRAVETKEYGHFLCFASKP